MGGVVEISEGTDAAYMWRLEDGCELSALAAFVERKHVASFWISLWTVLVRERRCDGGVLEARMFVPVV